MYVTILKALRKSAVNTFVYVYLTQHFSTLLVNGAGFFPIEHLLSLWILI